MLVAQTSKGVARISGGRFELLDVGDLTLSELVKSGSMSLLSGASVTATYEREDLVVEAPITSPGKVIIVGLNYRDHAAEVGMELPTIPRVHLTVGSAVIGPGVDIVLPAMADSAVDFEGEMAVIIGARATDVPVDSAWRYVAGITGANDISARDVQDGSNPAVAGANIGLAKGFDGFKPLGPALLTADEAREMQPFSLRTLVDGEVRQDSSTGQMHFSVEMLIAQISRYTSLYPGDVILTGTPGGVGLSDGRFLRDGQIVEVELEGVGVLRNRVVTSSHAIRPALASASAEASIYHQ